MLGSLPFSLGHLGTAVEDHLHICCHGRISELLSAGSNVAWRLSGCMMWVWVAHEKSDICFSGVCPSVAVLMTGWLLSAGLSCYPGGQVFLQGRFAVYTALSTSPLALVSWGLKVCGQCRILCRILQNPKKRTADPVTSDQFRYAMSAELRLQLFYRCSI